MSATALQLLSLTESLLAEFIYSTLMNVREEIREEVAYALDLAATSSSAKLTDGASSRDHD